MQKSRDSPGELEFGDVGGLEGFRRERRRRCLTLGQYFRVVDLAANVRSARHQADGEHRQKQDRRRDPRRGR
jgi:hypothetical protein